MPNAPREEFMIEDAQLIFKNFAGKESAYNRLGDRNFCAILDEDIAEKLANDEWNVRYTKPREEGDVPVPYIEVAVSYKNRPPMIIQITNGGNTRTPIGEELVETLDYADIANVDFIAQAYHWELASGKKGIKAYLKTMYVTLNEDALMRKYAAQAPSSE